MLGNRLKKNFKHLSKWARRQGIEAWRLYDRDIPEYPYIIDIYKDKAVVWLRLEKIDQEDSRKGHLQELHDSLNELGFPKESCFIKERKKQERHDKYQKEDNKSYTKIIKEWDLSFEVNLSDYLDTGLFLDHRPWRQKLSSLELKGKKALNLFCYTGSLSVALEKAGAHVTSVDLSPHYLEWAKRNFKLNHGKVQNHQWHCMDCLQFIKDLGEKELFDIIVIDPPSFSVSKKFKGTFDVERDHVFFLTKAIHHLSPGGKLFFSTNLRTFKLSDTLVGFKETTSATIPQYFHDKKIHKSYEFTAKDHTR